MHEDPAAVGVLDDRGRRTDRARVLGRQRQGRLRGHHGHRPPLPESHEIAISIIDHRDRGHTHDTPGNPQISTQNYRPGTGPMSRSPDRRPMANLAALQEFMRPTVNCRLSVDFRRLRKTGVKLNTATR
jgi:hypothetical protein